MPNPATDDNDRSFDEARWDMQKAARLALRQLNATFDEMKFVDSKCVEAPHETYFELVAYAVNHAHHRALELEALLLREADRAALSLGHSGPWGRCLNQP
jgi:hypothetical protein